MSESKHQSNRGWLAGATALLLVALVLYPLSIGPAAKSTEFELIPGPWLDTLYAPLWWLANQSETVDGWLWWYIELWWDPAMPPAAPGQ